ncbi:MAG: F0F1 ATP synthase subunit B' [Campylobacter sp.]|nr:F0F1 ATP synthase subunit B' [Campylobacter sp.]
MISISFPAFILTIVVFIALVGYLNRRLYQPMLAFMDARDAAIKRDEEVANKNLAEVDSEAKEIEEILARARNEAAAIRQEGLSQIEADEVEEIQTKKESLDSDFNRYLEELNKEKEELRSALESSIPDFRSKVKNRLARI